MDKLAPKTTPRKKAVRKTMPKRPKRSLPDVRKFAGSVPGMDEWALEEVRKMRNEW